MAPSHNAEKFSEALGALLKYEPPGTWPVYRCIEEMRRGSNIADILEVAIHFPDRFRFVWLQDFGPCVMSARTRVVQPRHGLQVQVFTESYAEDSWEHWRKSPDVEVAAYPQGPPAPLQVEVASGSGGGGAYARGAHSPGLRPPGCRQG